MAGEADRDSAERRQLTVLFCDLVGSTSLSEQMEPEDLRVVLRDYQHRCAAVLRSFGGHVAQYLGDGLMAYFGYPAADEDAAQRAVSAGLSIVETMTGGSPDERLSQPLGVRVGIHTGSVVVGEMGDETRPERLAVGTTPNLAARMQSEAEPNSVLVSQATYALVAEYFECQSLGTRQLRGVSRPVALHRVVSRSPVSSRLHASERRGFSPFAGRDAELAILVERWNASRAGTGRGVLVVGDAGVGKSRLALELTRVAHVTDVINLAGVHYAEAEPFYGVSRFLERWIRSETDFTDADRCSALATRLTELGLAAAQSNLEPLLAGEAPPTGRPPSVMRHAATIQAVVELFAAMAARRPILVLIEDLHWVDASTREVLGSWLSAAKALPVLTVATIRSDTDLTWARAAGFEVLALGALPRDAARSVAHHVTSHLGASPEPDLVERVLDRADGVPLFVEELARALAEAEAGTPPSSLAVSRKSDPVPASLQDSLMARLDRLGSAKAVAQLAAIAGREVPLEWLEQLSPGRSDVLRAELAVLVRSGLLRQLTGPEPRYEFVHALMHDAAYQSLVKGAREELHQRVADMLVGSHTNLVRTQPLLLAHHYLAAGSTEKAIRYLIDAGHRMMAQSALGAAVDILQRAFDMLPNAKASPTRDALEIDLLTSLGLAYIATRGYSAIEVEEVFSRARQICDRAGDVPLRVLYGIWGVHLVRADLRGISRLAGRFERIAQSQDADERLVAHACLGVRAFFRTSFAEARQHLRAALDLVDREAPKAHHERMLGRYAFPDLLSGPLWLAFVEAWVGDQPAALRAMEVANDLAERIGDPQVLCQVASFSSSLACLLLRLDDTLRYANLATQLATQHQLYYWQALAYCQLGWAALHAGKVEEATSTIGAGLSMLKAIGSLINLGAYCALLVEAHLKSGGYAAGLEVVDEALALCRETMTGEEPELLRLRGELLDRSGVADEAVECLRAALAASRLRGTLRWEARAAVSLAQFLRRAGKLAEAREILTTSCKRWPLARSQTGSDVDAERLFDALEVLPAEAITSVSA